MDLPVAVRERRGLTRKGDHAFLAERIKKNFRLFRKILKKFFPEGKTSLLVVHHENTRC